MAGDKIVVFIVVFIRGRVKWICCVQGAWANDCVHLPGRLQGTRCLKKNRNAGPVKCNALVRRHSTELGRIIASFVQ